MSEAAKMDDRETNVKNAPKKQLIKEVVLYGIIGCSASGFDFALFFIFASLLGFDQFIVNIFTVYAGMTLSFILNRNFNFKVKDNTAKRAVMFYCVGTLGLLLSEFILFIGSSLGLEVLITKIISIFIVALFQFILNKFISFGYRFDKARETKK